MGLSPAPVVTFPTPATSNPACRLPAPGFPVDFFSRDMGPIEPEWLSARGSQPDTRRIARVLCIATAYSTSADCRHRAFLLISSQGIWDLLNRSPAKTLTFARAPQMAPDLPLDPVFHVPKAPTRLPCTEVVDPSAQHRVDQADDPIDRLGTKTSKHFLELAQKRRTGLHLRHVTHTPYPPQSLGSTEVKPQETEVLAPGKIEPTRFFRD